MSRYLFLLCLAIWLGISPLFAAQLNVIFPQGRTVFQTNEWIDVSVVRSDTQPLASGKMLLTLTGNNGSTLSFTFPVAAVPLTGADARATEHYHLNGWLIRPGMYILSVSGDGANAQVPVELYSDTRRSSFKTYTFLSYAKDIQQAYLGEDSLGFNMNYAYYGGVSVPNMMRGGLDYLPAIAMGGAHQVDMVLERDWSDPYVLNGAEARVVQQAMQHRINGNCLGVQFADEPGLTWLNSPFSKKNGPHDIPAQRASFKRAFGVDPIPSNATSTNNDTVKQWMDEGRFKLGFMEAVWKYSAFGVTQVKPDFLSVTQSVYAFFSFSDGYYFNITRPMPIISGHGGYDVVGPGYLNPSFTFNMGRMRDFSKPNWYLPTWFNSSPDLFRLEQYASFMDNLQGMGTPPDVSVHTPYGPPGSAGVIETNKLMARLGPIFTTMPVTIPPVAVLWSISNNLHVQATDPDLFRDGWKFMYGAEHLYTVSRMIQTPIFPIVDEDILDGSLATHHKILLLAQIDYLDAEIISQLEQFIANGGIVMIGDECKVEIKGAQKVGMRLNDESMNTTGGPATMPAYFTACLPLAKALSAKFTAAGIMPNYVCDSPYIFSSRQALGDIEYLFALNVAPAPGDRAVAPATAKITIQKDGRTVYDAVRGGAVAEFTENANAFTGAFRFGPGQLRVFASTRRPIGGIVMLPPSIMTDYTRGKTPVRVDISATLVDGKNIPLVGSAPMQLIVTDPLGAVRYDLYRATDRGTLACSLPLALNDPAGDWSVTATDLLANTTATTTFVYHPDGLANSKMAAAAPTIASGAVAGATARAVLWPEDREHIFNYFRNHHDVTIITGSSAFNEVAAKRLVEVLMPWNIRCTVISAAAANKRRELSEEQLKTWVGLGGGRLNAANYGVNQSGFAVNGATILLGTAQDNPLIAFAVANNFLPYRPDANFPGRGRGYLAWQRDAVAYGEESITMIATDEVGMDEAVGTLYEIAAALTPLMPLTPPVQATGTVATKALLLPAARAIWTVVLPDTAVALVVAADNTVTITTNDGTMTTLDAKGKSLNKITVAAKDLKRDKLVAPQIPEVLKKVLLPYRIAKYQASQGNLTAIGYWGGTLQIFATDGTLQTQQLLPQDLVGLAWAGDQLISVQSDGRVTSFQVK